MSAPITVYRTRFCPYCVMAARLLEQRGIAFDEVGLDDRPDKRAEIAQQTGWRTVPMIFVGETFVGGFTELAALERSGKLDSMLEGQAP